MRWRPLPVVAFLLLPACGRIPGWGDSGRLGDDDSAFGDDDDGGGDDDASGPGAVAIHCLAPAPALETDWLVPATMQLQAELELAGGGTEPATGVAWSMVGESAGSVNSGGLYTASGAQAGPVAVRARWGALAGDCSIDVHLRVVVDETGDGGLASAVPGALASALADPGCSPVPIYPQDGAVIPWNLAAPRFQWQPAAGGPVFVLELESAWVTVQVTTYSAAWTPDGALWEAMPGGQVGVDAAWSVFAGTWDAGSGSFAGGLCGGAPQPGFRLSDFGMEGSIFYWSPTSQGLWRIDTGAPAAVEWVGLSNTGSCVGCHAVNLANPDRMAMNYGGGDQWAVTMDVADAPGALIPAGDRRGNFMALNPDGTRQLRSFQGALYLDSLPDGANLGTLPTSGHATHPNWSPDGARVVYSSCSGAAGSSDWVQVGCSIRALDVLAGDQFGGEQVLLSADPSWNYYYPSFSPDSQWIVLNRSTGDSYDDPDSELVLIPAWGGTPLPLARANAAGLTNSWPRWGPAQGEYAWIAFASRRPYGAVTAGNSQIWIAAVDFNLAVQGLDPSFPAAWLGGQDPAAGNHTPVWVPRYTAP